jgi:putative addiction module component (TIGR02574 family)
MSYPTTSEQARFVDVGRAKDVLKKELRALNPADRAEVAEDALRSLDGTAYGELSPAWEDEIQRRARAVDDGSAELIPGEEVFKEIEAELRARRGRT